MAYPKYYLFLTELEASAYVTKVNTWRGYHQDGDVTIAYAIPRSFLIGSPIPVGMWGVPQREGCEPDSLVGVLLEEYSPSWNPPEG